MRINWMARWMLVLALLAGFGAAMAATEPTLEQVYQAAQSGRVDEAQKMMQLVLVAHPNSAKAHFVQAELSGRQGQLGRAREELALAEKLAPGLPFAKPEAVASLRSLLASNTSATRSLAPVAAMQPARSESPFPWGTLLLVGGGIAVAAWLFARRNPPQAAPVYGGYSNSPTYPTGGPLAGQQGFGYGAAQPMAGPGLGSRVAGGLATGLAVGAGVLAAEAIGKSLMGGDHEGRSQSFNNDAQPFGGGGDMGGQNFGVNDAGSWDDGGGSFAGGDGGGGGWDS